MASPAERPAEPGVERVGDRRALQSVSTQFFANGVVYATFVPQLPEIQQNVGISIPALGLVLTLASISGLIGSVLTGRVIVRFGTRRVMLAGAVLSIGSLPLVGLATTPTMLVAGLVGLLFFDVFIDVAMNVQGSVLSARRRMPVMNRLHGLWSLGGVAGGAATVLVNRADISVGVHLSVVALGLVGVLVFVAPGLLRVDEPHGSNAASRPGPAGEGPRGEVPRCEGPRGEGPRGEGPRGEGPRGSEIIPTDDVEDAIRHRRFGPAAAVLALGGATAMMLEVANGDWAAFRLGADFGARPGVASAAFLAFTIGMTSGRLGGDSVQARVGATSLRRVGAGIAGVGSLLATLVPVEAVSMVGFLVAGLGTSVLFPQLYDQAARMSGAPGTGFAAMLLGQRSAAILTPLVVGVVAGTAAFGVGDAMALLLIPAAAIGLAISFVHAPVASRR